MISRTFKIEIAELRSRSAELMVRTACKYPCRITVEHGSRSINAKSMMGVFSLELAEGDELTVVADGEREQEALADIAALIESKFQLPEHKYSGGVTMNRIGVMAESFGIGVPGGMERAAQLGAAAVQVYVGGRGATQNVWTPEYRREIRNKAHDCGLVISAMCGDLGGHAFEGREENDEWRIAEVGRMFELCQDMDCTILTNHIGRVPSDKAHPRYAVMVDAMQRIDRLGRETGCYLAIETGPETPETLKGFLEDIGGTNIGINYDPANLKMVLDVDAAQGVRTLAGHILHTHAKDGKIFKFMGGEEVYGIFCDGGIEELQKLGEYFQEVPLGEGDVDWDSYIAALNEIGYKGYFTIERECGADPTSDIRQAVEFLRRRLG